jgi:hypothetical protein
VERKDGFVPPFPIHAQCLEHWQDHSIELFLIGTLP